MSQDSLQELIDIFASSTSQDSNISNPANEAISEKICNDGGSLIKDPPSLQIFSEIASFAGLDIFESCEVELANISINSCKLSWDIS